MKETKIEVKLEIVALEELSPLDAELINRAIFAADKAYAPYSNFHVGASLLLTNGKIITGNNQENAAYPSGLCAERIALFHAGSQYPDVPVRAIAIAAKVHGEIVDTVSPCGACRQVMLESELRGKNPIRVLMCGKEAVHIISSAKELLPLAFCEGNLP